MRFAWALPLLLGLSSTWLCAQQDKQDQSKLKVNSRLVEVPVLAKTRSGHVVFGLTADDFLCTDNGVAQGLTLSQDTDSEPLALAIVAETGGAGAQHLSDYRDLGSILDALIGGVDHRVAVIGFDSEPHLLISFTANTDNAAAELAHLSPGDEEAHTLDGIVFALAELRAQPPRYRRAILLLSETIDQGSKTTLDEALRLISDTNTAMYSFGFSSARSAVVHEASKLNGSTPGPAHGCFSRKGADPEYNGHYSKQVLDCISQLAPPLRLATMAFLTARDELRTKTAESIAELAGGEFFHFHNAKDLKEGMIALANDIHNYYVLTFKPATPTPGLHTLHVEASNQPHLELKSRREYWIDDDASQ
ncbi:MAG TPA: VWA domain-containing protein [Candidatus Angelobacter sp.]|nr:VWA domain-containing protein [Candidatus Angelobacter sp.]